MDDFGFERDLVVTQDITRDFAPLADIVTHVVLSPVNPENAAFGQRKQMFEVHVSLVEHHDLSRCQPRAQGDHAAAVVVGSFFDHCEGWQEGLQIQAHVQFRSGFAPPVFRPVHAVATKAIVEESIL